MCSNKYEGTRCYSVLLSLQICESIGTSSLVYISSSILDQTEVEDEIEDTLYALDLFIKPSDKCRDAVIPFLCLYTFGLCGEDGREYRPTEAQCSNIRDNLCESEWKRATDLLALSDRQQLLPDCSNLNSNGLRCDGMNLLLLIARW